MYSILIYYLKQWSENYSHKPNLVGHQFLEIKFYWKKAILNSSRYVTGCFLSNKFLILKAKLLNRALKFFKIKFNNSNKK